MSLSSSSLELSESQAQASESSEHQQSQKQQHQHQHSYTKKHSLCTAYQTFLRHDSKEQEHWDGVCNSFRQYAAFAMSHWANTQYRLHAIPEHQRNYLPAALRCDTPAFYERAECFKDAAIRNQFCLDSILTHAGQAHSQESTAAVHGPTTDAQMSKVSSVLKSLLRDWSNEGKPERDMTYIPILEHVKQYVPLSKEASARPRICVPGAGVGRLALEICAMGYTVQGNEFSLHMLLASDFILNGGIATTKRPLKVSPFLLESRNVHRAKDPTRFVSIPDVDPYSYLYIDEDDCQHDNDFSMAAGDFVSIYSNVKERNQWDAVVACFFMDSTPSIVETIQVIYAMLRPGGVLINFGPLHWHWSGPAMRPDDQSVEEYHDRYAHLDSKYFSSIDLCWEDVREILLNVGFEILTCNTGKRAMYTSDRLSMMNMDYRCISLVVRKHVDPK
jgi:carnosine N-methyltransferase